MIKTERKNLIRYMGSLALILQESAEIGQMDSQVHADIAELIAYMATRLEEIEAAADAE